MKKKITILIILAFVLSNFTFAVKIEVKEAQKIAINFYYEMYNKFSKHVNQKVALSEIKLTETYTECLTIGIPDLYIFNVKTPYNEGFIIVTADDAATPVVGYSFQGAYSTQNQPPAFALFIDSYKKGVAYIRDNNIAATPEVTASRNKYLKGNVDINAKDILDVAPLLATTWAQGIGYNSKCPADAAGEGGHALTGCVATATSQVMNYHMWPTTGYSGTHTDYWTNYGTLTVDPGSTTYLWNQMLRNQGNDAVATLLYHVGVCVDMHYGATASGTQISYVPNALTSHFKYANSVTYATSPGTNPDATWKNRLRAQCDVRRPMVYGGYDGSAGHAWVCDGYQGTDYFDMNWGWNGSDNGYFMLTNLNAGGYNFISNQMVAYDIIPVAGYPTYCSGSQTFTTPTGVFEDGSGNANYQPNANCSWLIDPTDSIATLTLNFEKLNTESGSDVVTIYDGKTTAAPILGQYSGSPGTMPSVVTTKPWALVTFTSDANSTVGDGFRLRYNSTYPVFCASNTNITATTGTVYDGSGDGLGYNNNTNCQWTITPSNSPTSILIHWLTFNTEATNDHVDIINNNVLPNVTLTTFSGTSLPTDYTCNTPKIKVKFKTNSTVTGAGWSFWYETITSVQDRTGINSLAIYPVPANNMLNFSVAFDNVKDAKVKLINILGETIYSENVGTFNGEYKQAIDVKNFAKGMYIMEINTDKGNMTQKVIID
ncbi:MAG: C10 family peptidase [Bacteroidales bacterium]|jgi:hypothetical protein